MRIKELKPGMLIHCPEVWMAIFLLRELEKLGYKDSKGNAVGKKLGWNKYQEDTVYHIWDDKSVTITDRSFNITEFIDIVYFDCKRCKKSKVKVTLGEVEDMLNIKYGENNWEVVKES